MIEIRRPPNGPPSLKDRGERQTRLDCKAYDACPEDYLSGRTKFPKREYYSEKEVKDVLLEIQNGKCCYCETKFGDSDNLEVEHFRPKGGVRQSSEQKEDDSPGYYWLAYCWENLLLSCRPCNQRYKRTLFPLHNPEARARSHHEDIARERPLFVDPATQDPRAHIWFLDDTPEGITPQGRATIAGLGLCRVGLNGERRNRLNAIRNSLKTLALAREHSIPELEALAQEVISEAMRPDAKFSSMVIDYLERHPL